MTRPLSGLRIVDLTTIMMGPWCTRIVADLGADVIKVEAPEGDSSRYGGNARNRGMGGGFQHTAKRKRSLVLDLKKPAARDVILRLTAEADAFVSNIRPPPSTGWGWATKLSAGPTLRSSISAWWGTAPAVATQGSRLMTT